MFERWIERKSVRAETEYINHHIAIEIEVKEDEKVESLYNRLQEFFGKLRMAYPSGSAKMVLEHVVRLVESSFGARDYIVLVKDKITGLVVKYKKIRR